MPELYSQVLDLKEKDVFLETEVNDTRYFSVTGIPSTLSYGKHPFSITFNDPEGQPLLKNLSNIVFEFIDSRGTVIFSDLLDIEELSGAGNGVLWIKKDPLRTAAEIADGPVYLYVMGELDGDEIPEEWKGIYNVRSTFVFDARKDYPNTSNLVLKNPLGIQTNLNISESIEFDTADSIFKRSFINVSLTNLDTDGGKIESVELAYNEQSASNDEYEVITRYPLTSGSYEVTDSTKISGLNPISNTSKIITPKQFRRNTSVRFRLRFLNPAGQLAQYLDEDRQGEVVEVTSSFITFEGSPFFLERFDNLLKGSMFTGNAVGKGFEQSGKNSAFLKTVDYTGFISASNGSGSPGILFYSGSVLPDSGDNYNGVGLELHGGQGNGSFRFSTNPNLLEIQADTFFVGSETSQFISGSGGNIEISSSGYHLTPQGTVTASAILLGDKSAGQFLQFSNDVLTVQGSITADSIRTPASIGGAPSTDQNASSSISAGGFATFKSASIGGFVISPTDISSSGLVLKSSGQMTGSTTLIGDKGAGQFLQFAGSSLTVQGDITANSIRTPSSIGGSPSTIANASSSIDSQGFALFKSASIGGFDVNETEISSSGLLLKSSGQMTGSSTLIGNKAGGNFLQFAGSTLTVQGDITANSIKTPATINGVASTIANASASITSDGLATFKSGSIAGWQIFGNILSGSNVSLDSQGAALFKSDQGPGTDTSAAFDILRDEYYIDFTPADQGNTKNYYVKFGPNFAIDSTGILHASGAVFQGTISASAGLLGGFTIDDNSLHSTNIFISGSPLVGGIDDDKYMFISTSKFNVKENGDITGSSALFDGNTTIGGTLNVNGTGEIAGFGLTQTAISSSNDNLILKSSGQITGSSVLFTGGEIGGFTLDGHSLTTTGVEINDSTQTLFISSSAFKVDHTGNITGSQVLFSGGKIAGFDINGTKLQQDGSFHLDGNASAEFFISSSNFQVTPDGDITGSSALFDGNTNISGNTTIGGALTVNGTGEIAGFGLTTNAISSSNNNLILKSGGQVTGSNVLFDGGTIGGFTISSTQINDAGNDLILKSSGQITASSANIIGKITSTAGSIGGFDITNNAIKSTNNALEFNSALAGLFIKDGGGTNRVIVKSGSLGTVGGGTQYIGNKSFEEDTISAGRNFVSSITSWSFVEGGGVNISLTDRSSYPDDNKAVSGDVTLDVVVPAGSGNYSANNTYELVQVITASVAQGDTISFSSVGRFSSSFGGRGKDRALGPQYFRLEYSGSGTNGFVPFLPANEFTASNGYGEYFLGSGQYSSFGASADLPSAASFIKVVITGSINDDTGFTIEKPLFAGDKGTVNSDLKGRKFTKQVKGSTTAEFPETEITFDNFSVRSNTRRVEVSDDGLLIYNSEDSFFKMTGAGIELRGGSGLATFGSSINRESFTNDSQVAGTLGAPSLQPYTADPEDIGTTASDGNVAEFAKGNHVHRITFSTINSVLSGQTLTNVFNGTFGANAASSISGSFVAPSASFSTRITTLEGLDTDDDLNFAGDSGTGTIDFDTETFTIAGGAGMSSVASGNSLTLNLDTGILSSSAQIASDISGSFTSDSSSLASRLTTEEGNIDTLQGRNLIAGTGLTGGGTLSSDRTFNVGEGTGISVGADAISTNDSEIVHDNLSGFVANEHINHSSVTLTAGTGLTGGGDITTNRTFAIDFTDSSFKSAVSGSYKGDGVISSSAQIATDISGSFTAASSSFSSRITTIEAIDTDDDLTIVGDTGGSLSIDLDSETLTIAGGTGIDTSGNTNTITVTTNDSEIVHDNLSGFVANEHIDHSTVSVIAGDGLTGGGTIAANRTLNIGAGTGIDVAADAISVDVSDFMTNGSDNRIVTATGTDAMNAEANLTFDGSKLAGGSGINFEITSSDGNNNSVALASMAGRLKFGNEYSDSARGPNKISMYDDGLAWIGGFGVHNGVVSYYTGNNHKWYKSNSQTSFTEVMGLDSSGNLTIGGTVDGVDVAGLEGRSIIAGNGLTGGGTLEASRTLNIGAGTGIDVAADAISVDVSDFMTNGANNRVLTSTGTDAINAEANLTFDGSTLNVVGNISGSSTSTGSFAKLELTSNITGSDVFTVDGLNGRLFTVTDEMSGSIFSANLISGLPVIEAFSDNRVNLGPFSSPIQIDSLGNISGSSSSTGSFGAGYIDNKLGIGTLTPLEKLSIRSGGVLLENGQSITWTNISDGNTSRVRIQGDEAQDYIRMRVDNNNAKSLALTTTGVGIGNLNPTEKLTVEGDISASGDFHLDGQAGIGRSPSGDYALQIQQPTGTNNNYIQGIQDNGSNTAFRIDTDSGDNVSLRLYNGSGGQMIHLNGGGTSTFSGTGGLEIAGNISGSSTSTGSFGHVFANGTIHGKRGSSGATVHPSADEAIFENSANAGISILSGNSNEAAVYFGDSDDNDVGRVRYDHSDDTMDLITGAAVRATVAATKTTFTQTQGIELINTGNNTVFHIPSSAGYTFGTLTNNHMSMWTNNTERVRILNSGNVGIGTTSPGAKLEVIGDISGSSTSTGSFGAIGIGTAPSVYKLNVEGTVRISGLSFYHNVNNPQYIWNSGNLTFRHGSPGSSNVILKLRSTKLESALEHHFDDKIVVSGDITGSGNLEIAGNVSGSSTSTGSFGHVFTSGTSHFSGHVGIQTAPGSSNELTIGGGGFVRAEYFRGLKFYHHSSNTGMDVNSNHVYFDDNDLNRIFHIKRDGGVQISGSHDSTGSFGSLISRTTYIGEYTPIFNEGANMLVVDSGDAQILSIRRGSGNNQWNFGLSLSGDLSFRERTDDVGSGTTHHIFYKAGYVKFGGHITGSGNLEIAGNISGSATSTGSFGHVKAASSVFTNLIENVAGSSLRIKAPGNDVILDTGDNDIQLYAGGSEFARLTNDSNTLAIKSSTSNADIVFNGVDSGANITALRLDMSEAGKAIFNSDVSGSSTSTGSFGRVEAAGNINLKSTDNALTFTTGSQELSLSLYKAPGASGMNHSALMLGGQKVFEPRRGNHSYFYSFNSINFQNDETASTGNARFIFGDSSDTYPEVGVFVGWSSLRSTTNRQAEVNGFFGTIFTKQGAQDDSAPYIQFGSGNTNLDAYFYSGSIFVTGEGSSGDIVVQGTNAKISGSATSTGSFGNVYVANEIEITDSNTRILEGSNNAIKLQTNSGYIEIGPMNTAYAHITTDRSQFYFSKKLIVDEGIVQSYDENLILRRTTNNANKITITDGSTHIGETGGTHHLVVNGNVSGSATSTGSFGVVHAEGIRGLNGTYGGTLFVPEQLALGNDTDTMIRKYTSNVLEFRMGGQDLIRFDGNNGKVIVENANLEPQDDDTRNLGASDKRWSDVFAVQTTTGGVFETGLRTEKIGDNPTGTIVSWRGDGLVPCDSNEDELVMGVIKEGKDEPIVMGAEPVLVTGKVNVGDYIVTSDKIGHGKSVKRGYLLKKDLFGKVIAQALEPSDDSDSSLIKCMIRKM